MLPEALHGLYRSPVPQQNVGSDITHIYRGYVIVVCVVTNMGHHTHTLFRTEPRCPFPSPFPPNTVGFLPPFETNTSTLLFSPFLYPSGVIPVPHRWTERSRTTTLPPTSHTPFHSIASHGGMTVEPESQTGFVKPRRLRLAWMWTVVQLRNRSSRGC